MNEEISMYAHKNIARRNPPILFQCQNCEEHFSATDSARNCPYCLSSERSNLVILHMEEDEQRSEWLELVDFSAGD